VTGHILGAAMAKPYMMDDGRLKTMRQFFRSQAPKSNHPRSDATGRAHHEHLVDHDPIGNRGQLAQMLLVVIKNNQYSHRRSPIRLCTSAHDVEPMLPTRRFLATRLGSAPQLNNLNWLNYTEFCESRYFIDDATAGIRSFHYWAAR